MRIEPDPCIPIVARSNGSCPDRARHLLMRGSVTTLWRGDVVGAQVLFYHDAVSKGFQLGRYVYPREDLRPDGFRILKGF